MKIVIFRTNIQLLQWPLIELQTGCLHALVTGWECRTHSVRERPGFWFLGTQLQAQLWIWTLVNLSSVWSVAEICNLAWRPWPEAWPHTVLSSSSVWGLWRRVLLHNPPPPTERSVWRIWHPCPIRRESSRNTWSSPPWKEKYHMSNMIPRFA